MSFVIMTVGKTHSGKTTFGHKIAKKLKQYCLLDSDILAEFLKEYVPDLYKSDFVKNSNKISSGYNLKKKILTEIYKHALKTNIPIIITNANSTKEIRKNIYLLSKKEKHKLILVYFDLPEKVLINRIKKSKKSTNCLTESKNFLNLLLNKQAERFEKPNIKEADIFFKITDNNSYQEALKEILKLIKIK